MWQIAGLKGNFEILTDNKIEKLKGGSVVIVEVA